MKIQRDYGGAYDIDPNMYFTRDDLLELANEVIEILNKDATEDEYYDIEDIWMDEDDTIYMSVIAPDESFAEGEIRVDMRRIRRPKDLLKYANSLANSLYVNSRLYKSPDDEFNKLMKEEH